ncbi:MAG: type II toxin-antitoxin system VapC family toxin, partial [Desulfobacterales bacterium]
MLKLLLDTHVLLWWLEDSPLLNTKAKETISKGQNQVYVSAATTWEASIKKSLGKLEAPDDLDGIIKDERFLELPISCYHGQLAGHLPPIHRDPFDRMLVAQAQA